MTTDDDWDDSPHIPDWIREARSSGIDGATFFADLIAELERMPDGPDQPHVVDSPPPEDRP